MAEQTCKECEGHGDIYPDVDAETARYISPEFCPTCEGTGTVNRTGPYRLTDGTWSDGVDRSKPINLRATSNRWEVTAGVNASYVWHKADRAVEFDTWAEAIAYADHAARTTKNGDNK